MKVKRFNNIWTAGLIIFGVILLSFYVVKLVYPQFIIGVAQIPEVIAFGEYVDTHLWAYYLFNFSISYIGSYVYYCACCRQNKLKIKQNLLLISMLIVGFIIAEILPDITTAYNYTTFVLMPFLMLYMDDNLNKSTFISFASCFCIDIMAQALSLEIRDVVMMTNHINSATIIILLIDGFIWRAILYCFFNYKNNKKEE